eukprot:Seg1585.4 transcript_id=Seg1585.4/GoldUCD/mRNA.D3Y31 product="hypothetical protein" protein_id=Seg1585.4/GoldUCD/D3Y31
MSVILQHGRLLEAGMTPKANTEDPQVINNGDDSARCKENRQSKTETLQQEAEEDRLNAEIADITEQIKDACFNEEHQSTTETLQQEVEEDRLNTEIADITERIKEDNFNENRQSMIEILQQEADEDRSNTKIAHGTEQIKNDNFNEEHQSTTETLQREAEEDRLNTKIAHSTEQIKNDNFNEEHQSTTETLQQEFEEHRLNKEITDITEQIKDDNFNENHQSTTETLQQEVEEDRLNTEIADIPEQIKDENFNLETQRAEEDRLNSEITDITEQIKDENFNLETQRQLKESFEYLPSVRKRGSSLRNGERSYSTTGFTDSPNGSPLVPRRQSFDTGGLLSRLSTVDFSSTSSLASYDALEDNTLSSYSCSGSRENLDGFTSGDDLYFPDSATESCPRASSEKLVSALEDQIDNLEENMRSLGRDKDREIQALDRELQGLKLELTKYSARENITILKNRLDLEAKAQRIHDLEEEVAHLQASVDDLSLNKDCDESHNERLRTEVNRRNKRVLCLEDDKRTLEERLSLAEDLQKNDRELLDVLRNQLTSLEKDLLNSEDKNKQLEDQVKSFKSVETDLKAEKENSQKLKKHVDYLNGKLKVREQHVSYLEDDNVKLQQEKSVLQKRTEKDKLKIDKLNNFIKELKKDIEVYNKEIEHLNTENSQLEHAHWEVVMNQTDASGKLAGYIEDLEQRVNQGDSRIRDLEFEIDSLLKQSSEMLENIVSLQGECEEGKKELEVMTESYNRLQGIKSDQEKRMITCQRKLKKLQKEKKRFQIEKTEAEEKISELKSIDAKVSVKCDDIEKGYKMLQLKLQSTEAKLTMMERNKIYMQSKIDEFEKRNNAINEKIVNLNESLSEYLSKQADEVIADEGNSTLDSLEMKLIKILNHNETVNIGLNDFRVEMKQIEEEKHLMELQLKEKTEENENLQICFSSSVEYLSNQNDILERKFSKVEELKGVIRCFERSMQGDEKGVHCFYNEDPSHETQGLNDSSDLRPFRPEEDGNKSLSQHGEIFHRVNSELVNVQDMPTNVNLTLLADDCNHLVLDGMSEQELRTEGRTELLRWPPIGNLTTGDACDDRTAACWPCEREEGLEKCKMDEARAELSAQRKPAVTGDGELSVGSPLEKVTSEALAKDVSLKKLRLLFTPDDNESATLSSISRPEPYGHEVSPYPGSKSLGNCIKERATTNFHSKNSFLDNASVVRDEIQGITSYREKERENQGLQMTNVGKRKENELVLSNDKVESDVALEAGANVGPGGKVRVGVYTVEDHMPHGIKDGKRSSWGGYLDNDEFEEELLEAFSHVTELGNIDKERECDGDYDGELILEKTDELYFEATREGTLGSDMESQEASMDERRALTSIKCVFQVEPDIPSAYVSCSPQSIKSDSYSKRTGSEFAVSKATHGYDSNLTDDHKSSLARKHNKAYNSEQEYRKPCEAQPVTPYYTVAVSNVQPCHTEQISSRKDDSDGADDSSIMRRETFGCSKSFQISHENSGAIILTIPSASLDENEDSDLEIDDQTTTTDKISPEEAKRTSIPLRVICQQSEDGELIPLKQEKEQMGNRDS